MNDAQEMSTEAPRAPADVHQDDDLHCFGKVSQVTRGSPIQSFFLDLGGWWNSL